MLSNILSYAICHWYAQKKKRIVAVANEYDGNQQRPECKYT